MLQDGSPSWVSITTVVGDDPLRRHSKKWTVGVKKVAGRTYKVVKSGGAWLIYHAGKLVALVIRNIAYTFSREVGKSFAKRILAAK